MDALILGRPLEPPYRKTSRTAKEETKCLQTTGEVKKRTAWTMFMGFLIAVLGLFLIVYPFIAGAITAVLLGWILIFVGIAQFIFPLHSGSAGRIFLKVLLGVLLTLRHRVTSFPSRVSQFLPGFWQRCY
jgi:uncharacterized membrane protein HdeD (DUF308 family)